ncbi:MAG: proteasome accessory factor PafA2 family protein, partial [Actinomycetota bacterium]
GLDIGAPAHVVALVLDTWEEMLHAVETMSPRANQLIDWVAKRRLVDGYRAKHDLRDGDPRLKAIDLQYHDLRPEKCLASRCGLDHVVSQKDVVQAIDSPPGDTRAFMRGMMMKHFSSDVVSANWDSVVVDVGDEVLKRIDMPNPLRGTRALVASLFTGNPTLREFLRRLEGDLERL